MALTDLLRRWALLAVPAAAFCMSATWLPSSGALLADEAPADDLFAVPETKDPEELVKFINGVRASRPPQPRGPNSYREYRRYQRQAGPAIAVASQKILDVADKKSKAYATASGALLQTKVTGFTDAEPEDRIKMLDAVAAHLKQYGVREAEASVAYGLSQAFEQTGDIATASRAYQEFGALMKTSEEERIRNLESAFSGPGRRLGLVGSEMEVFGKTLDGKDFDFSKMKGKVVLIDFWATWCGPCVAELPNVKEAYDKYHDKGFEVVGVSLDERRFALDDFLKKNEVPWPQLHDEEGPNRLAAHYDVSAIPFMALVGRDGKVISIEARGRQLHHELEKIFGPVASDDKPEASPAEESQDKAAEGTGAEAG